MQNIMNKTVICMNGPPTSGKGAWSKIITALFPVPVIGVGDLLRDAKDKGILDDKIVSDMDRGILLDSEFVWDFLKPYLPKDRIFILDGFPRKPDQVDMIFKFCAENNFALKYINIEQSVEKTKFRLSLRKHVSKRMDDNSTAIETRLSQYEKLTKSLKPLMKSQSAKFPKITFTTLDIDADQIELYSKLFVINDNVGKNTKSVLKKMGR